MVGYVGLCYVYSRVILINVMFQERLVWEHGERMAASLATVAVTVRTVALPQAGMRLRLVVTGAYWRGTLQCKRSGQALTARDNQ